MRYQIVGLSLIFVKRCLYNLQYMISYWCLWTFTYFCHCSILILMSLIKNVIALLNDDTIALFLSSCKCTTWLLFMTWYDKISIDLQCSLVVPWLLFSWFSLCNTICILFHHCGMAIGWSIYALMILFIPNMHTNDFYFLMLCYHQTIIYSCLLIFIGNFWHSTDAMYLNIFISLWCIKILWKIYKWNTYECHFSNVNCSDDDSYHVH